jgi:CHRD domain-containing protein
MKRLSVLVAALALLAAGCGSSSSTTTSPSTAGNPIFTASLSPANEVPPVTNGESGVTGSATITFNTTKDSSGNITAATANFAVTLSGFPAGSVVNIAHIHEGAATCACPVVVNTTLGPGEVTVTNGLASFTKTGINVSDPAVAQRIINSPGNFYFNVHTALNSGGVARGVLVKAP